MATLWFATAPLRSRSARRLVLAASMVAALTACAIGPSGPVMFDCAALGLRAVTSAAERIELEGLSLLPPAGSPWCIGQTGPRHIAFMTSPLLGRLLERAPPDAERLHTFAADAGLAEARGERPQNVAELKSFVERWLRVGSTADYTPSGVTLYPSPQPRFRPVSSTVVADDSLGAECVRFEETSEERDNPGAPGSVLILVQADSFLCLHPHAPGRLVYIGISERYLKDAPPATMFVDTRRQDMERFVKSLRFTPIP